MPNQGNTTAYTPAHVYGDAGLIYIRYHERIEIMSSGQNNNIGGARPALNKIAKQIDYAPGTGKYYSLLMGREFRPGC